MNSTFHCFHVNDWWKITWKESRIHIKHMALNCVKKNYKFIEWNAVQLNKLRLNSNRTITKNRKHPKSRILCAFFLQTSIHLHSARANSDRDNCTQPCLEWTSYIRFDFYVFFNYFLFLFPFFSISLLQLLACSCTMNISIKKMT